MRVNRSAHLRFFTTISNEVLRDSRLSFCARGVLSHLLSLLDGRRGDIRTLADQTPEGRERVASALRELERLGYLKREVKRAHAGRLFTDVEVFEAPHEASAQVAPTPGLPGSGSANVGPSGDHPVIQGVEEPTHPTPTVEDSEPGREGDVDDEQETKVSAALLERVTRAEPQLSLGRRETLRLAPLVTEWRRRGASDLHVFGALTAGLPKGGVHHPERFLDTRLRTKMPAEPRIAPALPECDRCRAPVAGAGAGLCQSCRETKPVARRVSADVAEVRARGVALARAALRGLAIDTVMPAPA